MSRLTIAGLHKHYGSVHAVRGIDLEIPDGEFTVLVGPSGCGKSTLLRMIAGLEELHSGSIHIGGIRVDRLPAAERGIAMVFQNYALYPHMTVFENMAFGLRIAETSTAETQERVQRAANILQISEIC